jgi:hypothetical protein
MSKTKISEYSATANSNTDVGGINIDEGCAPSGINDAIRTLMAQLKNFQTGTGGDSFNGPVGSTTPAAGAFTTLAASSTVTLSGGTANGVGYLNGSKVLTTGSALTFNGTSLGIGSSSYGDAGSITASIGVAGTTTGGVQLWSTTTGSHTIQWGDGTTGSDTYRGAIEYAHSGDTMRFYTSATEQMRLTSTGLGIGTSSLASRLTVKASGGTYSTGALALVGSSSGTSYITNAGGKLYVSNDGSTDQLVLDASGNLGVGTTSPSTYGKFVAYSSGGYGSIDTSGQFVSAQLLDLATAGGRFTGYSSRGALGAIHIEQTTTSADGGYMAFRTCASGSTTPTERARIDSSGNLLVGTTSTISAFNNKYRQVINPVVNSSAQYGLMINANANAYTQYAVVFADTYSEQIVGSISFTTSATAYNTSSDYRLKNTIAPMTGALAKVALLKPCTYKWNVDGSDGEGFIAHELAEVVPQCVTGEKDAMNEDGSIKAQGIDTSFLVATLTAAIQELKAEFDAYKATHP